MASASNAFAQVNGPGQSDPNDFDTAFTAIGFLDGGPGETDITVPSSVGNTNGDLTRTTQINVNISNGTPVNSLDVFAGAELNQISCSSINRVGVFDGGEANIFGDVLDGLTANSRSFVNVSEGGFSSTDFSAPGNRSFLTSSGSIFNIDGGGVASFRSEAGSEVNLLDGGVDGGSVAGTFNISGGSDVNSFGVSSGNVVNLFDGGTLGCAISFSDGSELNIFGWGICEHRHGSSFLWGG